MTNNVDHLKADELIQQARTLLQNLLVTQVISMGPALSRDNQQIAKTDLSAAHMHIAAGLSAEEQGDAAKRDKENESAKQIVLAMLDKLQGTPPSAIRHP